MKLIILEGGDRLGKSTLIKGLCEHFNYDNVTVRHFGKPPKGMTSKEILDFQFKAFKAELYIFYNLHSREQVVAPYYPEVMIWNRSHLGEYVYSQMFRDGNPGELKNKLLEFEKGFISFEVYLITLTASPEFFNSRESDGHELSKTLEQKTKELELFKEAHEFSIIANKLLLKVDKTHITADESIEFLHSKGIENVAKYTNIFRSKEEILNEVINFIK